MDLTDRDTRAMLGYKLESQTNDEIDLKLLKAYLEATEKYGNTKVLKYQALKLKYEALITVPTIIEKTMTSSQLYLKDSPLWIKGVAWPFSGVIVNTTKSKDETAKFIDLMLGG